MKGQSSPGFSFPQLPTRCLSEVHQLGMKAIVTPYSQGLQLSFSKIARNNFCQANTSTVNFMNKKIIPISFRARILRARAKLKPEQSMNCTGTPKFTAKKCWMQCPAQNSMESWWFCMRIIVYNTIFSASANQRKREVSDVEFLVFSTVSFTQFPLCGWSRHWCYSTCPTLQSMRCLNHVKLRI